MTVPPPYEYRVRDRRGRDGRWRDGRSRGARERSGERGVPDGLLVGVLAFLLGLTALTWSATGLAGWLAHGGWPEGVRFQRTPSAMRALLTEPHDMAAAWPDTPPQELSGWGLFWGVFIGQLMVLVVLSVFVLGVVARWRGVRAARAERAVAKDADIAGLPPRPAPAGETEASGAPAPSGGAGPGAAARPPYDAPSGSGTRDAPGTAVPGPGAQDAAPAGAEAPGEDRQPLAAPAVPTQRAVGADTGQAGEPHPQATAPGGVAARAAEPERGVRYGAETGAAGDALRDAEGATVVVTGDPELYAGTAGARSKLGPVHVYDPAQLTDAPVRLRWAPHQACEDMEVARARAAALLAPVRSPARADAAVHAAGETLLRCWLHAAALSGEPFRQVHRWALSGSSKDAVRILRTDTGAASGAAGELEATLTAYPERREAATDLVRRVLAVVSQLHVRNACTASRTDRVAWESFVPEGGTLYVVGESLEDPHRGDPGAMPLLTALTSAVVEHGRRMAARSSSGRLDPPLTVVLDHPATVAPLPELPELLAEGETVGIETTAFLRSEEQTRRWWPDGHRRIR